MFPLASNQARIRSERMKVLYFMSGIQVPIRELKQMLRSFWPYECSMSPDFVCANVLEILSAEARTAETITHMT